MLGVRRGAPEATLRVTSSVAIEHRSGRCAPNVDLMQFGRVRCSGDRRRDDGTGYPNTSSPLPVRRRGRWHLTGAA